MTKIQLTTAQMVEVDRLITETYGITLHQMMENAGRNLAEMARRMLTTLTGAHVTVVCGLGNNGDGGMVAARHLHNRGARVDVVLVGEVPHLKPIPAHQWGILQHMAAEAENLSLHNAPPGTPIDLPPANLLIDALIGYGLQGDPRPLQAAWIRAMNAHPAPILSLDAPAVCRRHDYSNFLPYAI